MSDKMGLRLAAVALFLLLAGLLLAAPRRPRPFPPPAPFSVAEVDDRPKPEPTTAAAQPVYMMINGRMYLVSPPRPYGAHAGYGMMSLPQAMHAPLSYAPSHAMPSAAYFSQRACTTSG